MNKYLSLIISIIFALGNCSFAFAVPTDFSFAGTFAEDDEVQLFNFTANGSSTVTLRSYSYAGGTQADGNVVTAGGFDPILALFDSTGTLIDQNDDDLTGTVPPDPVTGSFFDVFLEQMLVAGDYTVSITEFDNFAIGPNLSDGFANAGQNNFTGSFGCSNGSFCDVNTDNRTNFWAFDILGVEAAQTPPPNGGAIPEPTSLALLGIGLAIFQFGRWRRAERC